MKITIELTEAEVKGLKDYLKDVGEMKGSREEIKAHLENIVSGVINSPNEACSSYIAKYLK